MISQAVFVFYFKIRAKNNFIVDSFSFYITEVSFVCCQDPHNPISYVKMGNPRWPLRNHEKLQMLVSLQPTKIKTCMIYVF